jgi:hypothetical protein
VHRRTRCEAVLLASGGRTPWLLVRLAHPASGAQGPQPRCPPWCVSGLCLRPLHPRQTYRESPLGTDLLLCFAHAVLIRNCGHRERCKVGEVLNGTWLAL